MTQKELDSLEERWKVLYRRRRKLNMELQVVNNEMREIEKKLKEGE